MCNIRANFENLEKKKEQVDRGKTEVKRAQRIVKERQKHEEASRQLEVSEARATVLTFWEYTLCTLGWAVPFSMVQKICTRKHFAFLLKPTLLQTWTFSACI